MKQFLICAFVLTVFLYFANGSIDEERRFREGNSFARKMKACSFICNLKGSRAPFNQTRCYRIPSKNVVVTDCGFKCLRNKGESPEAVECSCRNTPGVCDEAPATTEQPEPTTEGTTEGGNTNAPPTDAPATNAPATTNAPVTGAPVTNAPDTNQPPQDSRRTGNQGKKGVKGQNSNKGNRSKQKS